MNIKNILESANGVQVLISEGTQRHMLAHPEMEDLYSEAVRKISISAPQKTGKFKDGDESGDTLGFEIDMGRTIGVTICVPASILGQKTFTRRFSREIPIRVVIGVHKASTEFLVVWLRRYDDDGRVELRTCYAGKFAPREPSDPFFTQPRTAEMEAEFQISFEFWNEHALIHDGKTETWKSYWSDELSKLNI